MFEAGALGFRIQMIGAELFKKDAKSADDAVKALGESAEKTTKKVAPTGEAIDKTGKAAKAAKAPVEDAGKATKKLGDEADTAAPKVKKTAESVEDLKKKSDDAGQTIGVAAVGIGAAVAAMSGLAVKKYAEFDEAMSAVGAASMATAADQERLGDAAIKAGADSVFSATEAANAQIELSKAGVSTADILGGALTGSLALAAAGQLGVARAAEISATALTVFKLKGDQATHVADLLAAGAGKAQGSVEDLSLGLDYVGVTFARLKIPLEDTVGTLALLASNGLLGEKAGTGLRSVISSLTAPVKKGAEVMAEYGISVFDAQGNFIGMAAVAEELKVGLGDLNEAERSAALGAIFGAEAASAAGILYASGAEGVKTWTDNVNDQGYAAEQARRMTDNLTGDIERLGGAMDSALIQTGSAANDALRGMVQIITTLVDWYGSLDGGIQGTVLWLGIGTGAALLLGGTMLLMVPKIAAFKLAMQDLNTTMGKTAVVGGVIGIAITAAALILGAYAKSASDAKGRVEAYTASLDENTGAITKNTRETVVNSLMQNKAAVLAADTLGLSLRTVTDAVLGEADALKRVNKAIEENKNGSDVSVVSADALGNIIASTTDEVARGEEAWRTHANAMGESTDATEEGGAAAVEAAPGYTELEEAVDGVVTSLADLFNEFDALNGIGQDAVSANAAYQESLAAITEDVQSQKDAYKEANDTLSGFTLSLDESTVSGSSNAAMLSEVAAKAQDAALAQYEVDKKTMSAKDATDKYLLTLGLSRDALAETARANGYNADEVQKLIDKVYAMPTEKEIQILADTEAAAERLRKIQDLINGIGKTMAVHVSTGPGSGGLTQADGGVVSYYANGGTTEHHTAQIAKAGTMRVWAEPETGGEAYIPLAGAKRGRSTAILADVATQFGYQLVPVGSQSFADGGRTGGRPAPTAGASVIQYITTPPNEDPRILAAALGRELMKGLAG